MWARNIFNGVQADASGTATNKCWPIRRALIIIVIVLYALTTINFAATWSYIQRAFIDNGQSFWTESLKLEVAQAAYLETGITSSISTILADIYGACDSTRDYLYQLTIVRL